MKRKSRTEQIFGKSNDLLLYSIILVVLFIGLITFHLLNGEEESPSGAVTLAPVSQYHKAAIPVSSSELAQDPRTELLSNQCLMDIKQEEKRAYGIQRTIRDIEQKIADLEAEKIKMIREYNDSIEDSQYTLSEKRKELEATTTNLDLIEGRCYD